MTKRNRQRERKRRYRHVDVQTDKEKKVSERITYLVTERQTDGDIGRKCKKDKKKC
jgi:hypothetical protein